MTRKEFEDLVFDTYNVRADYPMKRILRPEFFAIKVASGLHLQ